MDDNGTPRTLAELTNAELIALGLKDRDGLAEDLRPLLDRDGEKWEVLCIESHLSRIGAVLHMLNANLKRGEGRVPAPKPFASRSEPKVGRIGMHVTSHGSFQTSAEGLDRMMEVYLPASINELRAQINERADHDYSDLSTVTECLLVLAELDGYATN